MPARLATSPTLTPSAVRRLWTRRPRSWSCRVSFTACLRAAGRKMPVPAGEGRRAQGRGAGWCWARALERSDGDGAVLDALVAADHLVGGDLPAVPETEAGEDQHQAGAAEGHDRGD